MEHGAQWQCLLTYLRPTVNLVDQWLEWIAQMERFTLEHDVVGTNTPDFQTQVPLVHPTTTPCSVDKTFVAIFF